MELHSRYIQLLVSIQCITISQSTIILLTGFVRSSMVDLDEQMLIVWKLLGALNTIVTPHLQSSKRGVEYRATSLSAKVAPHGARQWVHLPFFVGVSSMGDLVFLTRFSPFSLPEVVVWSFRLYLE